MELLEQSFVLCKQGIGGSTPSGRATFSRFSKPVTYRFTLVSPSRGSRERERAVAWGEDYFALRRAPEDFDHGARNLCFCFVSYVACRLRGPAVQRMKVNQQTLSLCYPLSNVRG